MLVQAGFGDVAILTGGLSAWEDAAQPEEYGPAGTPYDGP